jgi:hypothetical protein
MPLLYFIVTVNIRSLGKKKTKQKKKTPKHDIDILQFTTVRFLGHYAIYF